MRHRSYFLALSLLSASSSTVLSLPDSNTSAPVLPNRLPTSIDPLIVPPPNFYCTPSRPSASSLPLSSTGIYLSSLLTMESLVFQPQSQRIPLGPNLEATWEADPYDTLIDIDMTQVRWAVYGLLLTVREVGSPEVGYKPFKGRCWLGNRRVGRVSIKLNQHALQQEKTEGLEISTVSRQTVLAAVDPDLDLPLLANKTSLPYPAQPFSAPHTLEVILTCTSTPISPGTFTLTLLTQMMRAAEEGPNTLFNGIIGEPNFEMVVERDVEGRPVIKWAISLKWSRGN